MTLMQGDWATAAVSAITEAKATDDAAQRDALLDAALDALATIQRGGAAGGCGGVMDEPQKQRLRGLLSRRSSVWHAGRTVGRTLYSGDGPDDLIGVMDTRPLAELVVLLHEYACEQLFQDRGRT